jgi:two-component system chemotaxis response regulator CheB
MARIRVLIADDSALMRREIKAMLESSGSIEVIHAARNGQEAVDYTKKLNPDVVVLDINMPIMDGMAALQYIMMESPRPVVMLSSLMQEGAILTYEALELGATDFVMKPGGTISSNIQSVAQDLIFRVESAATSRLDRTLAARRRRRRSPALKSVTRPAVMRAQTVQEGIVVIGLSTGGPNTIMEVLPLFQSPPPIPIVVVQHMPGAFTSGFAKRLAAHCHFPFKQVESGDPIEPGHGYLAPGDIHLKFQRRSARPHDVVAFLTRNPPDTLHTPSVDITMFSALEIYGANTIAVLMTGMGSDGAEAMVKIRAAGGRTIAESAETSVVFGMPHEAARRGGAEFVLPSYAVTDKIQELLRRKLNEAS